MAKVDPFISGMSCQGMIELIRQSMERFILTKHSEQQEYLDRIVKFSSGQPKERKAKTEDPFEQIWQR